jgi:hypothetical protein
MGSLSSIIALCGYSEILCPSVCRNSARVTYRTRLAQLGSLATSSEITFTLPSFLKKMSRSLNIFHVMVQFKSLECHI